MIATEPSSLWAPRLLDAQRAGHRRGERAFDDHSSAGRSRALGHLRCPYVGRLAGHEGDGGAVKDIGLEQHLGARDGDIEQPVLFEHELERGRPVPAMFGAVHGAGRFGATANEQDPVHRGECRPIPRQRTLTFSRMSCDAGRE